MTKVRDVLFRGDGEITGIHIKEVQVLDSPKIFLYCDRDWHGSMGG